MNLFTVFFVLDPQPDIKASWEYTKRMYSKILGQNDFIGAPVIKSWIKAALAKSLVNPQKLIQVLQTRSEKWSKVKGLLQIQQRRTREQQQQKLESICEKLEINFSDLDLMDTFSHQNLDTVCFLRALVEYRYLSFCVSAH